jgi:predicted small integral membrane protein
MTPNVGTGLSWMAWTWQTAAFFGVIALLLLIMAMWEWRVPGGAPRRGVLGLTTTRGDRLFISLLAAGYLPLLWLALIPAPVWGATIASVLLALLVFRFV